MSGQIIDRAGDAANGMVMDFSQVKELAKTHLVDRWDHAFLAYAEDRAIVDFLNALPDHKTVLLDCVPTAENLARIAFRRLMRFYRDIYGNHLQLARPALRNA